jgi:hypothetical protein
VLGLVTRTPFVGRTKTFTNERRKASGYNRETHPPCGLARCATLGAGMIARQNSFTAKSYYRDASVFRASCLSACGNKRTIRRFCLGTKIQSKIAKMVRRSILQRTLNRFAFSRFRQIYPSKACFCICELFAKAFQPDDSGPGLQLDTIGV